MTPCLADLFRDWVDARRDLGELKGWIIYNLRDFCIFFHEDSLPYIGRSGKKIDDLPRLEVSEVVKTHKGEIFNPADPEFFAKIDQAIASIFEETSKFKETRV